MRYFWVWAGLEQDLVVPEQQDLVVPEQQDLVVLEQDLVVPEQQDLVDLEQQDLVPDQTRPKNTSYFHYFVMNEHPIGAMKV